MRRATYPEYVQHVKEHAPELLTTPKNPEELAQQVNTFIEKSARKCWNRGYDVIYKKKSLYEIVMCGLFTWLNNKVDFEYIINDTINGRWCIMYGDEDEDEYEDDFEYHYDILWRAEQLLLYLDEVNDLAQFREMIEFEINKECDRISNLSLPDEYEGYDIYDEYWLIVRSQCNNDRKRIIELVDYIIEHGQFPPDIQPEYTLKDVERKDEKKQM